MSWAKNDYHTCDATDHPKLTSDTTVFKTLSSYNATKDRLSIDFRQNRRSDENGKGTLGCGSGWGCREGWLGCEGKGKGEMQKMIFDACATRGYI